MKLQRCANGHFYDGDKYPTCPHCQEAGLPGFKDDETVTQPLNRTPGAVSSAATPAMPAGGYGAGGGETVPVNGFGGGVTMPVGGYGVGGGETVPVNVYDDGATVPVTRPLSGVSADDDEGKPISIYDTRIHQNTTPPVTPGESSEQNGPCVGWLVCIGGVHIGRDFRLFVGRNTIGRGSQNGVVLSGDTSVSKEPQAIIAYEPQNNKFFAVPGTARSLSYVNGQVLLGMTELHKNDIIELGKAKLMLIPCCDEKFSWNMVAQSNG